MRLICDLVYQVHINIKFCRSPLIIIDIYHVYGTKFKMTILKE